MHKKPSGAYNLLETARDALMSRLVSDRVARDCLNNNRVINTSFWDRMDR